jgi:hypothetical protein
MLSALPVLVQQDNATLMATVLEPALCQIQYAQAPNVLALAAILTTQSMRNVQ